MTDSTISGCNATRGGAVYVASGSASLARSTISNCNATGSGGGLYSEGGSTSLSDGTLISGCSALSGGGLYSAGGRTTLSDGTLISGCSAEGQGNSIFLLAGEVSYALPAPAGRWLPNARCEVYRKACSYPLWEEAKQTACLEHRDDCALTESNATEPSPDKKEAACRRHDTDKEEACLERVEDPWYCQNATNVQPCNWEDDSSLLGQNLYQLPLLPVDQDFPFACAAGLRGSTDPTNQSSSACGGPCPPGTASAEGTGSCMECEPGTYAANRGQGECTRCPYPLSSAGGIVTTCSNCTDGFYLLDSNTDSEYIFRSPTTHCKPCPPHANCSTPTSLASLGVPAGYWRASLSSAVLTECRSFGGGSGAGKRRCAGSESAAVGDHSSVEASSGDPLADSPSPELSPSPSPGPSPEELSPSPSPSPDDADGRRMQEAADLYCAPGFYGPECQLCAAPDHHLVDGDQCKKCLAVSTAAGQIAALAIGICIVCGLAWAAFKMESWRKEPCIGPLLRLADRAVTFSYGIGLIPKSKVLLGFYQICIVLSTTYSVRLPERYTSWTDKVNEAVSIDWSGFFLPAQCLPYWSRLVAVSISPVGVIALLLLAGVGLRLHQRRLAPSPRPLPWHAEAALGLLDLTPASLFLVFCFVPSVSAFIFRAWSCQASRSSSCWPSPGRTPQPPWCPSQAYTISPPGEALALVEYMRQDASVECGTSEHDSITLLAIFLLLLWPFGSLALYTSLLAACYRPLQAKTANALTEATAFLHREYKRRWYWWEAVELARKLVLTGAVLLIPEERAFLRGRTSVSRILSSPLR